MILNYYVKILFILNVNVVFIICLGFYFVFGGNRVFFVGVVLVLVLEGVDLKIMKRVVVMIVFFDVFEEGM